MTTVVWYFTFTITKYSGIDHKLIYEAPRRLAKKSGGWLAGKIRLKSAWLTGRIKLAFYDIFAGSRRTGAIGR